MKTGDYARTKSGIIGKLIIKEETIAVAKWQGGYELQDITTYTIGDTHFYKSDIIKSSPNIIDLIEVGDYVNGERVFGFGKFIYDDDTEEICSLTLETTISCLPEDIKSIVTHEQFESMEYKL